MSPERERLAAVFQRKIQRLLDRLAEDRRWTDVLEWANHLIALGHAPEPGYRALMQSYAELGDRSGVAMAYQHCRTALFTDLGVEPSPLTQRLFARLAAGEGGSPGDGKGHEPESAADDAGPVPGTPPFRGLQYFDVRDADLFFGREPLTATLVGRLSSELFLAVIGASGSGKSSVVRAGLVAACSRSNAMGGGTPDTGNQDCWHVHLLTPSALPLVALLETWHRRRGNRLTLAGYAETGRVDSAIARTSDRVFAQRLTLAQQPIARRIFLCLTELGEGTQDTRRRAGMSELARSANEEAAVRAVLEVLAETRLITLSADAAEVAHEALIREWPMLREWLNQDRESLRLHRRLAGAAQEWERLGHDPGLLHRGAALTQAVDWADEYLDDLSPLEREFLETSVETSEQEAREREAQRELDAAQKLAEAQRRRADLEQQAAADQRRTAATLRRRALLLAGSLAIALVTAVTAAFFGDQAREQALKAQASGRVATARELAAAAISNLNVDPERATLLALQAITTTYAVDRTWTPEAEDALHRAVPLLRTELVLTGHTAEVVDATFSSNGQRIATASRDGTARIWDATNGQEQLALRGHTGAINAVVFSPDDHLIATASDDHTAKIWDATNGAERLTLPAHEQEVYRAAFSPDAMQLVTLSGDGAVEIWDSETGGSLSSFSTAHTRPDDPAIDITYTPGGDGLATISLRGTIREWDLRGNPQPLQMLARGIGPDQPQRVHFPFASQRGRNDRPGGL